MTKIAPFRTAYVDEPQATIHKGRYHDGSVALLITAEDGEPLSKATVCLSDSGEKPRDDKHVFIKDWAENEGTLKALQDAGIIGESLRTIKTGFVQAHECQLLAEVDELP